MTKTIPESQCPSAQCNFLFVCIAFSSNFTLRCAIYCDYYNRRLQVINLQNMSYNINGNYSKTNDFNQKNKENTLKY